MTIQNMVQMNMSPAAQRLASGNRINSAADDAAGMAIVENMTSQIRGLDQGIDNTRDMQNLVNTADGAMDTINDSLNRIRELSVQAANGTLTPANRELIQAEIDQLSDHIGSTTRNAEFNTMNLLDGSAQGLNTASGADGQGAVVNINDMSSLAQAITQFNVADDDFDINEIDSMINEVSASRAELGALHNRFDHTVEANSVSSLNMADSRSRINDADMAEEMASFNQERIINQMQVMMQQQQQEQYQREAQTVFAASGVQ